jgi:hypothetical protein
MGTAISLFQSILPLGPGNKDHLRAQVFLYPRKFHMPCHLDILSAYQNWNQAISSLQL